MVLWQFSKQVELGYLGAFWRFGVFAWAFLGVAGFAVFFVVDKLLTTLAETDFGRNLVGASNPMIITTSAGIIGLLSALAGYRHPVARKLADEVVAELSEVTWPTRDETYTSTVVVIITSLVAAVFTGTFDALWSALTNIVYAA